MYGVHSLLLEVLQGHQGQSTRQKTYWRRYRKSLGSIDIPVPEIDSVEEVNMEEKVNS